MSNPTHTSGRDDVASTVATQADTIKGKFANIWTLLTGAAVIGFTAAAVLYTRASTADLKETNAKVEAINIDVSAIKENGQGLAQSLDRADETIKSLSTQLAELGKSLAVLEARVNSLPANPSKRP